MIKIDETAQVSSLCDIEDSTRGSEIVVGPRTVIDSFVKIKPAGGLGDLVIGHDTVINSGCVFYTGNGISVGNYVAIAANCTFAPVNHQYKSKDKLIMEQGFCDSKNGIVIEDDVWVGASCVFLDGSIVRRGSVIGAGSIVRGEVKEFSINIGNPLVCIGYRQ